MSIFKVKSNIKHNGQEYKKGTEIELEENVAENLLSAGIIAEQDEEIEDEEQETPQQPVNKVTREGDDVEGDQTIEPGKVEQPQPGDNLDNEDNAPTEEKKEGILSKVFGGNKDGDESGDDVEGDKNSGDNL